jgi:pimeloyl-ACP methyl ester carboxylesterase
MIMSVRSLVALSLLTILAAPNSPGFPEAPLLAAGATQPGNSLNARFAIAAREACADRGFDTCSVIDLQREQLTEDIAHYAAVLRIGEGDFDALTIHRIVKERHPGIPGQVDQTFFFLHGSGGHFLLSMLNAEKTDGLGMYLAERNVDVWGLDVRWVRIPRTQTDFAFMRDWGFDLQVRDIQLATRFARYARRVTGQHFGGLNLAGWSLGASLAFAVANDEAGRAAGDRDVAGLIAMDTVYALAGDSTTMRTVVCNAEAAQRAAFANGSFAASGVRGRDIGRLALDDPDGVSPFSPPLTNRQLALNNASAFAFPPTGYHTFAVTRNALGQPVEGRFTETTAVFEALSSASSYRAVATFVDYFAIPCGDASQHHRDRLGDITLPVLYIGYAGGFGKEGLHTLTLLGSTDVTTLLIQLLGNGEASQDFGHSDWQNARDAVPLVRDPIWRWIESR